MYQKISIFGNQCAGFLLKQELQITSDKVYHSLFKESLR